jgi:predicted molibdopterin-dependent oxidoreductase YjgC
VRARARISGIRPGVVFVPFHYGYWDSEREGRAANELTITQWDPASKQPLFKTAAARVTKVEDGGGEPAPAPTTGGSAPARRLAAATAGGDAAEVREEVGS